MKKPTLMNKCGKPAYRQIFVLTAAIVFIIASYGCNKDKRKNYTNKMEGEWLRRGKMCASNYTCIELFDKGKIHVLSKTKILGFYGDTLEYSSTNESNQTAVFKSRIVGNRTLEVNTLVYNYKDNTISDTTRYSAYFSGGGYNEYRSSEAKQYTIEPKVPAYILQLSGNISMSGYVYDTFMKNKPPDTMYSVSALVNFSMADAMTVKCSQDFIGVGQYLLHFKAIDENATTITFESFHGSSQRIYFSRLIYNYTSKTYHFEQRNCELMHHQYSKLQG